ncbi:MAG: TetR/AcrR family transcriptional regulator [Solirubrobacteraceae bacterium]
MPGTGPPASDRSEPTPSTTPPAAGDGETLPLSRERVVAAAVALAERDGLDALSMRRLAGELGVSTMAAYRHVPAKQTLVEDVIEFAVTQIPTADVLAGDGDWSDRLEELVVASHRTLSRFPGLLSHLRAGAVGRPRILNWLGAISSLVEASGADEERRAGAVTAVVWCLNGAERLEEDQELMVTALGDVADAAEPVDVDPVEWGESIGRRSGEDLLRLTVGTIVAGLRETVAR